MKNKSIFKCLNLTKIKLNFKFKLKNTLFFLVFLFGFLSLFLFAQNNNLKHELVLKNKKESTEKINIIYFNEILKLKNYNETKYKIEDSGKNIIKNIRNLHKSPVLIAKEFQSKELCAGYISELSKKIWGKKVIYSIGMQNITKGVLAQAWELPYFYEEFGGKILIDLGLKFDSQKNNYIDKIKISDLKEFFAKAFSEEALFGDIGFLYSKTRYSRFLKNWNSNSHISKNMGISNFEIIIYKFDENLSSLTNLMINLGCNTNFNKYVKLIENYKIFLNNKEIIFYKNDFYYLNSDNSLGNLVEFKYLDKVIYKDITIAHFFEGKSHVDSLLQFTCKGEFYPVNVISINGRMIEKM